MVMVSWQSLSNAGEVVLTPGYIGGTIQVGSEKITYASLSATWSSYSASSTIYPNATTATYSLTANVPSGTTPSYSVSCSVSLNNNQYLYFPAQSVAVVGNQTSTADFSLNPGIIQGTIKVTNGGSLSSAYIYAYQSSTDGYTYSYRYSIAADGTYRMAVTPNTNIRVYGSANIGGANVTLADNYVAVTSGGTATVDWTIDPPSTAGSISGSIAMNGTENVNYLVVSANGPANKSQSLTTNGTYSLSGLPNGSYSMYAYAYFNSYDDYLQVPYNAFSPTRTPQVSGGDTTVDISANQAYINGNIILSGTKSLTDASSASITTQGVYGTKSYGGYASDRVNLQTGAYDLVLSEGNWAYRSLNIHFYNTAADKYLYEYLYLSDYNTADTVTMTSGETKNVDITYGLGSVKIVFRIDGAGTLSNPRLSGYCYTYGNNNQMTGYNSFSAYNYSQSNVQEGSVSFVAPEGTYTIDAFARVGSADVKFGRISVEVVAGADVVIDIGGPVLTVGFPSPNYVTSNSSVTITRKATDDLGVASVSVNGIATTLTSTNNATDPVEVSFDATINLDRGPNLVETIAADTSNKIATDKRTVYRDEGPPTLNWSPANGGTSGSLVVYVKGTATDDAGIDSIKVNNSSVSFRSTNNADDPNEVSFGTSVTLNAEGDTYITVIAKDISLRETSETHLVTYGSNQPPVADAGTYAAVEQSELGGAAVTLDGSGSNDPDGDLLTYRWTGPFGTAAGVHPKVTLPLGDSSITLVVNDGNVASAPSTAIITVKDTTSPRIVAPANVSVEQANASGTTVSLGTPKVSDICDASPVVTNDAPAIFPLGATTVTWTARDASGNSATASQTVTVVDTTKPSLSVVPGTATLWPPNHKYVTVTAGITVSDVCDTDVANKVKLVSVTSDEADEVSGSANKKGGGDGNAPVDIVIVNNTTVQLRAERLGGSDGRVYTLNYSVTDASGNTTTASATVSVPHSEGGVAVNSGVKYTVSP